MTTLTGKSILVIGASGAFGREFCRQLLQHGASVIGTAKTPESSVNLRADLNYRLLLDLESDNSIEAVGNFLTTNDIHIDGIIFAAGIVAFGSILDTPSSVSEKLMQVNYQGPVRVLRGVLPQLLKSADAGNQPFVLSISGVISERPMPNLTAYSASKKAINGYGRAASRELRKLGIDWIDARPGHTESGLASRSVFGTAPNFGTGLMVENVVSRILQGIVNNENDLPSESFV